MAPLRSTNPVFTRAPRPSAQELHDLTGVERRLTVDDVVVHTGGLLVLLAVAAGLGWALSPDGVVPGAALAAALVALGLSFFISFSRRPRPVAVLAYTAAEGLFVGGVSHAYEARSGGVVGQALLGTGVVFAVMLGLHRSGRLRATPRMQRIVLGSLLGVVGLSVLDLVLRGFGGQLPVLNSSSGLGVLLSVGILVLASLQFTLDFAWVEQAVAQGAPRSEAWRLSFGLVVSFVWVYLELLRLLGRLNDR